MGGLVHVKRRPREQCRAQGEAAGGGRVPSAPSPLPRSPAALLCKGRPPCFPAAPSHDVCSQAPASSEQQGAGVAVAHVLDHVAATRGGGGMGGGRRERGRQQRRGKQRHALAAMLARSTEFLREGKGRLASLSRVMAEAGCSAGRQACSTAGRAGIGAARKPLQMRPPPAHRMSPVNDAE